MTSVLCKSALTQSWTPGSGFWLGLFFASCTFTQMCQWVKDAVEVSESNHENMCARIWIVTVFIVNILHRTKQTAEPKTVERGGPISRSQRQCWQIMSNRISFRFNKNVLETKLQWKQFFWLNNYSVLLRVGVGEEMSSDDGATALLFSLCVTLITLILIHHQIWHYFNTFDM